MNFNRTFLYLTPLLTLDPELSITDSWRPGFFVTLVWGNMVKVLDILAFVVFGVHIK